MDFYQQREQLGIEGEKRVFDYLVSRGYRMLETNFSCKGGEIDLIASKGQELFFVEVKSRSSSAFGDPLESVHPYKQRRMSKAAQLFLYRNPAYNTWMKSFLVVIVWFKQGEVTFELIPNAFEFWGGY